jgi:hypothetical protein
VDARWSAIRASVRSEARFKISIDQREATVTNGINGGRFGLAPSSIRKKRMTSVNLDVEQGIRQAA